MSVNFKKFVSGPGRVNKEGQLPDPSELVCIEVPKIFDQCLIKRCIIYDEGVDTANTDAELRSDKLIDPKRYIGSRDFSIKLVSIEKTPIKSEINYKKLNVEYLISFYADYIDESGQIKSEFFEINRVEKIGKLYCPEPKAQTTSTDTSSEEKESCIIKLEMVADALDGQINKDESGNKVLDITLGYFIIVKSQFTVQLLVPVYNNYPLINKYAEETEVEEENIFEEFSKKPLPNFYPSDDLEPLFDDFDEKDSDFNN